MENNRFVAIDFETLESWRASVISIGIAVIEDNCIVDTFYTNVCPPTMNESYHCVKVHGLHYRDVKNCPKFDKVWEMINEKYIQGSPLIAHNVSFEKSCIKECGEVFGTQAKYKYYDTLAISRKYINKIRNYKLDTVSAFVRYKLRHHHNALEDAKACANIFIYFNKKYNTMVEDYDRDRDRRQHIREERK